MPKWRVSATVKGSFNAAPVAVVITRSVSVAVDTARLWSREFNVDTKELPDTPDSISKVEVWANDLPAEKRTAVKEFLDQMIEYFADEAIERAKAEFGEDLVLTTKQ